MNEKNLTLEEINTTAIENHQKGNLKTAENLYISLASLIAI
mgnify:CR=1 FL=1